MNDIEQDVLFFMNYGVYNTTMQATINLPGKKGLPFDPMSVRD
ncbi:hypothetical protein KNP414_04814 [Paenibacillus mucilaginosus KNP414]|uniref:Uncharacterized protein n=1 Tax=Paenibacillus mucilaginosus (strain KNP414) TaxID=1036673 RepID=F8FHZ8_PAEMK|nr:hypothetical protein KNP414_04814 [Paenibacillus mucilaginosus KNP414]